MYVGKEGEQLAWVGIDLDGTLAEHHGWISIEYIGAPIPAMLERVKEWRRRGIQVKIFTARVSIPGAIPFIRQWLIENGLHDLEITNVKDHACLQIWDDRAVCVIPNTGEPCCDRGRKI